jgi:outer membrane protein assembly factor BamA
LGKYKIHPSELNKRKRKMLERAIKIFEGDVSKQDKLTDNEVEIDQLYRQIGKLKVEKDFLVDRSIRLGLPTEKPW